jgi:hypothetical protein
VAEYLVQPTTFELDLGDLQALLAQQRLVRLKDPRPRLREHRDACSQRLLATISGTNTSTSNTSAPYSRPRRVSRSGVESM